MSSRDTEACFLEDMSYVTPSGKTRHQKRLWEVTAILISFTLVSILLLTSFPSAYSASLPQADRLSKGCSKEEVRSRREWRQLSNPEKDAYIQAVQCLQHLPGNLMHDQSLFGDFAFIHSTHGNISHNSALFLPWHRLFLIAYENALQSGCNYSGGVPYWDWSLDYAALREAPVWDSLHGFGGNGDESGKPSVGDGFCVTDGPFENLTALYFNDVNQPHCLSRGFVSAEKARSKHRGHALRPQAIEEVLQQAEYDSFWEKLEHGPHNAIPFFIRGDFSTVTAPNDPIFFSHHAQLDRLWSLWQGRDLPRRKEEYLGRANRESVKTASLQDTIYLGSLMPNVTVEKVMDTMGGFLCYDYT